MTGNLSGPERLRQYLDALDQEGEMQEEVYATRDRSYSAWHRRNSVRRYVGIDRAQLLSMIDLDGAVYVEYDSADREPLALIEVARDVGQEHKPAGVVLRLAKRAKLPAYVVLYRLSDARNPADSRWQDIDRFRIRRLHPKPEGRWRELTPSEWATGLLQIRAWSARKIDEAANDPTY